MFGFPRTLQAVAALVALGGFVSPAAAQDETAVFRSDSRLVVLHATVLDKDGHLATNLPQSAFRVFENGVEQRVTIFKREDAPVSIGLVIDDSGSMVKKRERVAAAALALVQASNPDDEVFILHFNEKPYLDSDFTSDVKRLQRGLDMAESHGTTALFDAMRLAIEHINRKARTDKKVLLVVSDGEDNTSAVGCDFVVKNAQQSGVLIYAVGLLSDVDDAETARAKRDLDDMTVSTGGQAYYLKDAASASQTAREIAHDIRSQYTLAYSPSHQELDGAYRGIRVLAAGPNEPIVRTRGGYWARATAPAKNAGLDAPAR
ncbi:MAG: VWA domain-containing protein [Bryobacteraceae bacterium]